MDLDASAARANESGVTGKTGGGKDRVAQGGMSPQWTALMTIMFNRTLYRSSYCNIRTTSAVSTVSNGVDESS